MTTKQTLRFGMGFGLLAVVAASAADYTWLNTPASANWNETDTNWSGAASVWVSASTNNAVFGASGTTSVTANSVTLNNLTFGADGYAILGGPLLMYGGPTVGTGLKASLGAAVTNVGVWTKSGSGTLVLDPGASGTNTLYSMKVAAGTMQVVSGTTLVTMPNSDPESGPAFWVEGGTLVVGGGLVRTTTNKYARVSGGGSLIVTNGLLDLTQNDELLNAHNTAGTTTVEGSGVLDVRALRISQQYGAASLAVVNVNTGGLIKMNNFGLDTSTKKFYGTVNFNGGTCQAKADGVEFFNTGNTNWSGIVAYMREGGAIIDNAGKNITVRQALLSGAANDGGLTKKGAGNLNLRGTNTYVGGTFMLAGSINIVHDSNLGAVPAAPSTNFTFVGNSTLMSSANHTLAANRTIRIPTNVTATFDTQGYTQTVSGVIYGENRVNSLVKVGSGMLIFDPGPTNGFTVSTLKTQVGTTYVRSGSNLVNIASGSPNVSGLHVNGGTLLVGGGELKTTGGGYATTTGGTLLITNGVVNLTSVNELLNAYGGNGNTTVSDSGVFDLKVLRISQTGAPASANVVNVNTGGTIRLNNFYIDAASPQSGHVNFNGGTVVAKIDYVDFLGSGVPNWSNIFVYARAGGAIIDTAGKSISIKQSINSGAAADGGLTKKGAGTLTLLNTNMYNGVTSVEGGSLVWGVHNALPPTNAVVVFTNALFNVNNKTQALARVGGSGTVTNLGLLSVTGVVAPGDAGSFGTLTLAAAPAALSGTLSVNVSTNGASDRLHVNGDLDLNALSLTIEDTAQLSKFKRYTVASCTGSFGKPFGGIGVLPERWLVRYDTAGKQAFLIYDFGTLMMVK